MKTVFVALSGGVDSTFSALKLKSEGYNVVALTMDIGIPISKFWVEASKRVAFSLGIILNVVDLSKEFKRFVIDYFVNEYLSGRTPNPCAICNKYIKFGYLRDHAFSMGADLYATGHYACLNNGILSKAFDIKKDQSYFLCLVEREKFSSVIFPMCKVEKSVAMTSVRDLVQSIPKESQEVCFLQGTDYRKLILERIGHKRGVFVDKHGNFLGEHDGYFLFTIGQRRKLGVNLGRPLYVIDIIPEKNIVVLGEEGDLLKKEMRVSSINWFVDLKNLSFPMEVEVKIRSQHEPAKAFLYKDGRVQFFEPQKAVTPGQVACFYKNSIVVAGAIIDYN